MAHLGIAMYPILAVVVMGAIAFAFAVADFQLLYRSAFGIEAVGFLILSVVFTGYHLLLLVDHQLAPKEPLFEGLIEGIVAAVAVVLLASYLLGPRFREEEA